jgi:hypothetical protein
MSSSRIQYRCLKEIIPRRRACSEVNYTITGMSMGMQTLQVLPQGLPLISIPWVKLPMIIENLKKMNWHPLSERITGEEHKKRFYGILAEITEKINK